MTEANEVNAPAAELAKKVLERGATEFLRPQELVEFAARAVPHADSAGLTVAPNGKPPRTLAGTGVLVSAVDAIQYATGQGPSLEAIEDDDLVTAPDLRSERRWAEFVGRAVQETAVRGMFSVRVKVPEAACAALNFYATTPSVFTEADFAVGALLASFAGLAVEQATDRAQIENLNTALQSSRRIGMAIGVLMNSLLIPEQEAFEQLRTASNLLQRKVKDLADEVTSTGVLPQTPERPAGNGRNLPTARTGH